VEAEPKRCWTLATARAMLADVRDRTAAAVEEVEPLVARREDLPDASPELAKLDEQIQAAISRWIRGMEALGLEVKGLWLVDFDNGEGYYCWKWPEERLDHFHGYDEGFDGRVRIQ
jgi:hypothetical protein